jgi:predicted nucleic acid-binding protein
VTFLLDTPVLAEICQADGDPRVKGWFAGTRGEDLYVSILAIGEIRQGIERLRGHDPARAGLFEAWLTQLRARFAERILRITAEIAEEWARLDVAAPLPIIDGLMAATAKVNGFTLVSRNARQLTRTGVPVLDPWNLH